MFIENNLAFVIRPWQGRIFLCGLLLSINMQTRWV